MNALDGRLGVLIERLLADLREALPADAVPKLVLYRAAMELLCEDMQPDDAGALGLATSHLALQALGVTDTAVERARITLKTGHEPDSLNRRQ